MPHGRDATGDRLRGLKKIDQIFCDELVGEFGMAGTTNRVELYPFPAPRKLERPDGFKTAAVSVDFGGNAVRLLVKEGSAGELIAAGKPPGGEYSAILTVAGDSWSSETQYPS